MAETTQNAGTTPLEPTGFWEAYTSFGEALQEMKRLADLALVDMDAMHDSLDEAWGYLEIPPMPENIEKTTAWAMEGHKKQLDELDEQINGVEWEIRLALDALDGCVTLADGMREFNKNAKAWGQLEEAKRGLKEASSAGRTASVIEKIDEAIKQLKHNASIAFLHT